MRLAGRFSFDYVSAERIKYNINGEEVEGKELAIRYDQKYMNVRASRGVVEAIEAAGIKPFTPISATIVIDTDVKSERNYRIMEVYKDGQRLYSPEEQKNRNGSAVSPASGGDPGRAQASKK